MPGKGCKKNLPDKPGGKVKGRGKVLRIRTVVPKPGRYIHVRVMSKAGPRGGRTIASGVQKTKRSSALANRAKALRRRKKKK